VVSCGIADDSDSFLEADEWMELEDLIEKSGDGSCTQNCEEVASRNSDDENNTADQEEPPKLKSYKEAVVALEEVSRFLEFKGHGDEVLSIGYITDRIVI